MKEGISVAIGALTLAACDCDEGLLGVWRDFRDNSQYRLYLG